jgi:hypothetical protein
MDPPAPDEGGAPATLMRPEVRSSVGAEGPGPHRRSGTPWRTIAVVVFAGQLAWLLVVSVHLWQRFSLTSDFALLYQAWHLIAHGHLSPTSTLYRTNPFVENHLELFAYPLALFEFIDPGGFVLLVLQDLATVAAELVAFVWIADVVREHWGAGTRSRELVIGGALVVLAIDPWVWWSDAFDVHLEMFAALFCVLAARSLWRRRWVTGAIWSLLALSCGTVESVALIGIGIGLIVSQRRLWRPGVVLGAVTVAWVLIFDALGFDKGSELATTYGYLTNAAPGTQLHATQVALGVLRHPHRVFEMFNQKRRDIWQALAGPGLFGVVSSIGFPVALVLIVPAVLNAQASVIQPEAAFQIFPVFLFVPLGCALALCWLSRRSRPWRLAALLVGLAALVESVVLAVVWIPRSTPYFVRTSPEAATVLARALAITPPNAEVIASNGFIGRFAARPSVYAMEAPVGGGTVPVRAREVEFVLSYRQGLETTPLANTKVAIDQIEHRLGARQVLDSAGIHVFLWHPGPGVRSVTLPGL